MDKVTVQVRFRKGIFTCKCGQEDIVDFNVAGGNTYENTCSSCGKVTNAFKNFDGILSYTPEDYENLSSGDISTAKTSKCDAWLYEVNHQPAYVEPSKEELEREKSELVARVSELDIKIGAKEIK